MEVGDNQHSDSKGQSYLLVEAAADMANMEHGTNRFSVEAQKCASIEEASEALNVSPRSVDNAKRGR